jgi:hypothetical protein
MTTKRKIERHLSDAEREALIDHCVETRLRWYGEDHSLYEEAAEMLRFGRVGYAEYSDRELVAEYDEMAACDYDAVENITKEAN